MEFALFAIIAGAFVLTAHYSGLASWKRVAEELGLEYGHGMGRKLSGTIAGFQVEIKPDQKHIEIAVYGGSITKAINLSREEFLGDIFKAQDIEIGCRSFDRSTHVSTYKHSSNATIAALLDKRTRDQISKTVVNGNAKVTHGKIYRKGANSINSVPTITRSLIELAHHLRITQDEIPVRLAKNAIDDPVSAVRLRNLTLLQRVYPESTEAAQTSADLLSDDNLSIRLAAAVFSPTEDVEVVKEIAQSNQATTDLRIEAFRHLQKAVPHQDLIPIATPLLKVSDKRLQRFGITLLGKIGHQASLVQMIDLLHTANVTTMLAITQAIADIASPLGEPALIKLLDHDNRRITEAAITALASMGTVNAVEPLHHLGKRFRFKRPARDAINQIQSRLGHVEAGRLSLAPNEDPAGGLSLADEAGASGGLSVVDSEDEKCN